MDATATVSVFGNRIAQIVFGSLFSIGIIVSNFLLIGAILSKRELRQNSKYILVLLLAVTDLYLGLVVLPLSINTLVTQAISYSCLTQLAMSGSSYIKMAMSCLAIVSINLDYIFQNTMRTYQCRYRRISVIFLSCFFLIGPLVIFIPMYVDGRSAVFIGTCFLILEPSYGKAALVLSYWAPTACIIFSTIYVIVIHQRSTRRVPYQTQDQPPQTPILAQNPSDLILAASLTASLAFPGEIISWTTCSFGSCDWYFIMVMAFGYIADARAFLVPLVWFVNKNFRNTVLGRGGADQPLLIRPSSTDPSGQPGPCGPPPPYYSQSQYLASPVQGQEYQSDQGQSSVEKQ